jgi:hypothetical protein
MAKIMKFVFGYIVFLSLFFIAMKVVGGKPFIVFKFPSLLYSFYTIFYHILVTLFYYRFSLQYIFNVKNHYQKKKIFNVKKMLIVPNLWTHFLLLSVLIMNVTGLLQCINDECDWIFTTISQKVHSTKENEILC